MCTTKTARAPIETVGNKPVVLPSQRHLFDVPPDYTYFNCAYMTPQLNEARARLHAGVDRKSHPWERKPDHFFADAETLRRLAADLFGGDADGYAIIPAASYGGSTAARAIEPHLARGDRILVLAEEFPSNVLPWRRTAKETGAEIVTVPTPADGNWTQAILGRMEKGVRIVAISNCHWTDGAWIDLEAIGAACRDVGAALAVDATQSLGAMPLSVEKVRPDFLFAAGYKWLLGPYGSGLLYVSERWRDSRPLEETWLARDNAEDFTALVKYSDAYMAGARRFDVGEKCTDTILPGAIAGLEQLKAWGIDNIAFTLAKVNERIAAHLERLGFRLPDARNRSPHMFGARLPEGYRGNLVAELAKQKIYLSQRGNSLRFSPHLHVTDADIAQLEGVLEAIFGKGIVGEKR